MFLYCLKNSDCRHLEYFLVLSVSQLMSSSPPPPPPPFFFPNLSNLLMFSWCKVHSTHTNHSASFTLTFWRQILLSLLYSFFFFFIQCLFLQPTSRRPVPWWSRVPSLVSRQLECSWCPCPASVWEMTLWVPRTNARWWAEFWSSSLVRGTLGSTWYCLQTWHPLIYFIKLNGRCSHFNTL